MAKEGLGRRRRLALLASSSCVALLMTGGGAVAAGCYTGPFPFTNNGALSCIRVGGTSFTGDLVNSGTGVISPGNPTGILVTNTSTITGQISNAGTISVGGTGIRVDRSAVVTNGIIVRIEDRRIEEIFIELTDFPVSLATSVWSRRS